ncbi:hypothetical protein DFH05DRAFT_1512470 [Lentinula detonsa]|uniref:Uncharacterized protein n=1 Tax=Lentinula detonsa TaxID=2804962 RepID=A0A9W8TT96_9AGAR|nr:hypothetical protein DFH05DRAFT_1512470 [Lentinula detonsa]
MIIYLPPPSEPSKGRPDTTQLNDRMRIIDNRRALKRIMTDCIIYRLKRAPPSFGSTVASSFVVSSSTARMIHRSKTIYKKAGIELIEDVVKDALSWNGLDKTDLRFYQTLVGRLFVGKGLALVVKHLHPNSEALPPSAITSLVEGLLIQVGQGNSKITIDQIRVVVMVCLTDYGHIFRRWQPLAGFEGTIQEAQDLSKRIFFDDFLPSETVKVAEAAEKSKKRGREEDSVPDAESPLKKAKLSRNASNRSSLLNRLKRKIPITN